MQNIVIISAYGRGAYLAHYLSHLLRKGLRQNLDLNITLVDTTGCMPALSLAEAKGPFGVFVPKHATDLQKKYLYGDSFYPVPKGFATLNVDGPIESQGPMAKFFQQKLLGLPYSHNLEGEWGICDISQKYFVHLKESLQKKGVKWSTLLGGEDLKQYLGNSKADTLVCALSGPEVAYLCNKFQSPECMSLLFPKWREPSYVWRYFSLSLKKLKSLIPDILLITPDNTLDSTLNNTELMTPQTNKARPLNWLNGKKKNASVIDIASSISCPITSSAQHFYILKTLPNSTRTQLWLLCPYAKRFNTDVLLKLLSVALKRLKLLLVSEDIEGVLIDQNGQVMGGANKARPLNWLNRKKDSAKTLNTPAKHYGQEYFVVYQKQPLLTKRFIKKPKIMYLNPEVVGKSDDYSMIEHSQKMAHQIASL